MFGSLGTDLAKGIAHLPRCDNPRTESAMLLTALIAPTSHRRKLVLLAVLAFITLC
ncbi:MAG: hypothetical protein ACO3IB_07515 [Phycisphaerales bacterium]